jgi:hypothetical protein
MLLPWLTVFDFLNFRANFKKPIDLYAIKQRSNDFALLVPIFNDIKYLGNVDFLRKYAKNVILCTTDQETPEFNATLEKIALENGFRISYNLVEGTGKNPWAIYSKTLFAHDAVLKVTTYRISEKYVIFIDGDTYVDGDLSALCGSMEENSFDLASVRVIPSRRETVMEHLQGIEYDIAMRSRLLYPWLTSGAGMIAKTQVMNAVLENHSLFFDGGDIEIGKLADMMGFKVGHIPMVFFTDVPPTFKRWMEQRKSWMCGEFRHHIVNINHNLHYPFHFLYFSSILYFFYPFKVLEIISQPLLIPIILALYVVGTYCANWQVRNKWMLIYPLYALFQVMIGIWQGIWRYSEIVRRTENYGKIRMTFNPNDVKWHSPHMLWKQTTNLSIIILATFIIVFGTIDPIQSFFIGRVYPLIDMLIDGVKQLGGLGVQARPLLQYEVAQINQVITQHSQIFNFVILACIFMTGLVIGRATGIRARVAGLFNRMRLIGKKPFYVSAAGREKRALKRKLMQVERAIELNPLTALLFSQRAQILAALGEHNRAVDSYLRALELQPATAGMPFAYGEWMGFDELTAVQTAAIFSLPESQNRQLLAEAYSIRATKHYKESRLIEAFNDYVQAFQLSASYADLHQAFMLEHKINHANEVMAVTQPHLTMAGATGD